MPPTFTTILAEHLARASGQTAHEAIDGEPVVPGTIYIAPGGKHMTVVSATTAGDLAQRRSAGQFLQAGGRSAVCLRGASLGQRELAVVLTGMGSDGARGAEEIVAAGGSVIAQDEATSVVWGMPGPPRMRAFAPRCCRSTRSRPKIVRLFGGHVVTPLDYDYLRKLLKERSGLVLSATSNIWWKAGCSPVARKAGIASSPSSLPKLRGNNERLTVDVVEAMTTNESFFFRDKIPFDHFRDTIMPALLAARARERRIRIWCAAASTGQEPYSLAMCLKEMKVKLAGWRVDILATDLSSKCSRRRRPASTASSRSSAACRSRCWSNTSARSATPGRSSPDIRAMVQFRPLNLLPTSPSRHFRRGVLPQRADLFRSGTKIGVLNRIASCSSPTAFWCSAPPRPWWASPTRSSRCTTSAGSMRRTKTARSWGSAFRGLRCGRSRWRVR